MSLQCHDPELDGLRAELRECYDDLEHDLARHEPRCVVSGRCCRFREFDHVLYLSGIEARVLLADAPPPVRPLDDGATCPWQDNAGRCTAREARPLGCRLYFCDPAFASVMPALSEHYHARLKDIAKGHAADWNYRPLHEHLRLAGPRGEDQTGPKPAESS